MSDLKAIETSYKGYRFRSRLEARWAVLLDALKIKWEYEKEGFDFGDDGQYLPDFWLPERRMWIEVKPGPLSARERRVAELLHVQSGDDLFLAIGLPPLEEEFASTPCEVYHRLEGQSPEAQSVRDQGYYAIAELCSYRYDEFAAAAIQARAARFEHGEYGAVESPHRPTGSRAVSFKRLALELMEEMEARARDGSTVGMMSGLTRVDNRLSGWQPGRLYVIGGRPGMGKSGYGLSVAMGLASNGYPGLIISLEMSARSLGYRALAKVARVDSSRLQSGTCRNEDWMAIVQNIQKMTELPITVEDGAGMTGLQIATMVRRYKQSADIRWFVLDYLTLAHMPGFDQNRTREIGELTALVRGIAKETDTCAIVLAQLSRSVEARGDKRPMLSDLRDSGEIEQHADVVQFIHRPEYYGIPQDEDGYSTEGMAEILTEKWRDGACGADQIAFVPDWASFENPEDVPPEYLNRYSGYSPFG